jgi:hypothetical protein
LDYGLGVFGLNEHSWSNLHTSTAPLYRNKIGVKEIMV